MNGRKAKALRRQAREMTIGLPEVVYHKDHPRRRIVGYDRYGNTIHVPTFTVVMGDCTRKTYQQLKRKAA